MRQTVVITLEDVREENLPRLRTAIKTHLVKFGRKLETKGLEMAVPKGSPLARRKGILKARKAPKGQ